MRLFIVFLLLSCVCGCTSKETQESDKITITSSHNMIILTHKGGQGSMAFTTTAPWEITFKDGQQWMTLSPTSGKAGEVIINAQAGPNTTINDREIEGTIVCGTTQQPFSVLQKGNTNTPVGDSLILISLYQTTNGEDWTKNNNWGTTQPLHTWEGVTISSTGRIIALKLPENNLSGTFPQSISSLTDLKTLILSGNKLEGDIPHTIQALSALTQLDLSNNNLTDNLPASIAELSKLSSLKVSGNRLSGIISGALLSSPQWGKWIPDQNILPQQQGYTLTTERYESSDYSNDGKFTLLQKAETTKGVDLIFIGDGFSDRDINEGRYQAIMQKAADHFFSIEPTKTYRNHFNVYAMQAVSKNERFDTESSTALGCVFDSENSTTINFDIKKCQDYIQKIPSININQSVVVVVINSAKYAGTTYIRNSGETFALCPMSQGSIGLFDQLILHEAVGHALGLLVDEYIYHNTTITQSDIDEIRNNQTTLNFGWNITTDRNNTPWKHFLNHPSFPMVGMYEGAYFYAKGVWRAEEDQCMNKNIRYFNGPSRELIVKRIKALSGQPYTWDGFLENDKYVPVIPSKTPTTTPFIPLAPPRLIP